MKHETLPYCSKWKIILDKSSTKTTKSISSTGIEMSRIYPNCQMFGFKRSTVAKSLYVRNIKIFFEITKRNEIFIQILKTKYIYLISIYCWKISKESSEINHLVESFQKTFIIYLDDSTNFVRPNIEWMLYYW